jgi:hypothetical protein
MLASLVAQRNIHATILRQAQSLTILVAKAVAELREEAIA